MHADPAARAGHLAELYRVVEPSLWRDLLDSGTILETSAGLVQHEWRCLALYACVRGLVAAGGFNTETVAAVDQLHAIVSGDWPEAERALLAERYAEYGRIGQELEHAGAAMVDQRLGQACAAHLAPASRGPALGELLGVLHGSMVEGATEAVRAGKM